MSGADGADEIEAPPGSAVQHASGWVLLSAVAGVLAGLVWLLLAPRVTITVTESGIDQARTAATAPFAADLVLGTLLLAAGTLLTVVWLLRGPRRAGIVGLVLGGLLAGALAAWLGQFVTAPALSVAELPAGTTVELGLRLRSWPMLLWWPAAALTLAAVFGRFSSPTAVSAPVQSQATSPAPE